LLSRKIDERQGLPEFSSRRLVHKVHDIDQFPRFLNELIRGESITVGDIQVSPEVMLGVFTNELKMRSYCQRVYGIDEACLLLTTGGNPDDDLTEALKSFEIELRSETEYASATSAIRQELGIEFGTHAYHPFIAILAPIEVKISKSEIKDKKFSFSLAASEKVDLADVMVSLEGYDHYGKTTGFTRNIKAFDRVENQINFHPVSIEISPYSLYVKLVLFFDNEIIEDFLALPFFIAMMC
jgi:hypothetical protein